jgi:DNA-binding NarL/FixJ family response regulator
MMPTELLLVDDDAGFRAAASALLETAGFCVRAEADSGLAAIREAAALHPAMVLLDVQLPDMDGFEVARHLHAGENPPVIILISTRDAFDYGRRVAESGVAGFISKSRLSGAALRAILNEKEEGI